MSSIARSSLTLSLVLLAGCGATGGGSVAAPVPVTLSAQGASAATGMAGTAVILGTTSQKSIVGASRDAVWAKLPAAYESLGIPVSVRDDAAFRLGIDQFKARRSRNGVPMRSILDCGSDLNGEKAETYDVRLAIETTVAQGSTADASEVSTTVSALGRSPTFSNGDVTCGTKGEIEKRILRFVRVQLGLNER